MFLRIEFICIIWTNLYAYHLYIRFLRIEFICIIWTKKEYCLSHDRSWGLNLFVLFEHGSITPLEAIVLEDWIYLYYLNFIIISFCNHLVLEDWIYLYYLNLKSSVAFDKAFLRIEFICIIWTFHCYFDNFSLFLRIEFICIIWTFCCLFFSTGGSWGLNLFVLFEQKCILNY